MNAEVEAFARLLYRGDSGAMADLLNATTDYAAFYRRNESALGSIYVEMCLSDFEDGPDPWHLLIDVGSLHHWVYEGDWSEFADVTTDGLRKLTPARSLPVDWDELSRDDPKAPKLFAAIQAISRPLGEVLVILDKGSDSHPLAFVREDSLDEAQRLAALIGAGSVTVFEEKKKRQPRKRK